VRWRTFVELHILWKAGGQQPVAGVPSFNLCSSNNALHVVHLLKHDCRPTGDIIHRHVMINYCRSLLNLSIFFRGVYPILAVTQLASFASLGNWKWCSFLLLWEYYFKNNGYRLAKLILMKIIKTVATRYQILRLKCTESFVGCGCAPDHAGEAYSAPPDPLAGFKGTYF